MSGSVRPGDDGRASGKTMSIHDQLIDEWAVTS
jgi:hypothetical protein